MTDSPFAGFDSTHLPRPLMPLPLENYRQSRGKVGRSFKLESFVGRIFHGKWLRKDLASVCKM